MKSTIMMELRRYTDADYSTVSNWYKRRDLNPIPQKELPKLGFIVPNIACSYLVQTDSNIAFLDGFISNPAVTHEERVKALAKIDKALIDAAQELGYKKIFVMTQHNTIAEECLLRGYQNLGLYSTFCLEVE